MLRWVKEGCGDKMMWVSGLFSSFFVMSFMFASYVVLPRVTKEELQ